MKPHSLMYHLRKIKDPRSQRGRRYQFEQIVFLMIYAILCGFSDCVNMEKFLKEASVRKRLKTDFGITDIPSHDTFSRINSLIDPRELQKALMHWMGDLIHTFGQIALDGKGIRAAARKTDGERTPYTLNVMDTETRMVITEFKIDSKSNEITAINAILETLDVMDQLITIDAIGTQKGIIRKILMGGGHYLLCVKDNQPSLARLLDETMEEHLCSRNKKDWLDEFGRTTKEHGRYEERTVKVLITDDWVKPEGFESIRTIARIKRVREERDGQNREENTVLYISDLEMGGEEILDAVSCHWRIENSLHWILDNVFHEDRQSARKGNAVANGSILRKLVYNLAHAIQNMKKGWTIQQVLIHLQNDRTLLKRLLTTKSLPQAMSSL